MVAKYLGFSGVTSTPEIAEMFEGGIFRVPIFPSSKYRPAYASGLSQIIQGYRSKFVLSVEQALEGFEAECDDQRYAIYLALFAISSPQQSGATVTVRDYLHPRAGSEYATRTGILEVEPLGGIFEINGEQFCGGTRILFQQIEES